MTEVQTALFAMQDTTYREFIRKLVPTVNPERIIGIRTPQLRAFARQFAKTPAAEQFLQPLPHTYYEENNLHTFVVETLREYDRALAETERFLPYIDNWATCDSFVPKVFKKHTKELLPVLYRWMQSKQPYTVRYGIGLLMGLYLDANFAQEQAERVAAIQSEEYYVNMMIAWYFATALAKQYDAVIGYLTENRLGDFVHNKTIQKAVESNRIPAETKTYLRTLRR